MCSVPLRWIPERMRMLLSVMSTLVETSLASKSRGHCNEYREIPRLYSE
jgi:hypothetical protein